MAIATLVAAILLAIGAQFLPLLAPVELRSVVQALAGLSAFFLGMTQSAFGKYIADAWTDRRRQSEQEASHERSTEEKNQRFLPFLQCIRNALDGKESEFSNDLEVVMSRGNITFASGQNLRIKAGNDFDRFSSMAKRLETTADLSISRDEENWMQFRLEDSLYKEILKLTPVVG